MINKRIASASVAPTASPSTDFAMSDKSICEAKSQRPDPQTNLFTPLVSSHVPVVPLGQLLLRHIHCCTVIKPATDGTPFTVRTTA